jgi:hypothetical protein
MIEPCGGEHVINVADYRSAISSCNTCHFACAAGSRMAEPLRQARKLARVIDMWIDRGEF